MALVTIVESWEGLVTRYNGGSLEDLLREANADYNVVLNPVQVHDKFLDQSVVIPERFVTGREIIVDGSKRLDSWEVVKARYQIVPNMLILQSAARVAANSGGRCILYGCGTLDKGRKFFVVLSTGTINISLGHSSTEIIDTYIVLITSHDGSIPICYYNLDVRRSTKSVLRFSSDTDFCVRRRHTPTGFDSLIQPNEVLALRDAWTSKFPKTITSLLVPFNMNMLKNVLEVEWSEKAAATEKSRFHIQDVHRSIQETLLGSLHAGVFGMTKLALFTAVCDYIDFKRDIPAREAAQHSLEIDNYSHRTKVRIFSQLQKS